MIKIQKRYTIKFSYAGINQYAEFSEVCGKLLNPNLWVGYAKSDDIPSVENLETIDEVLEVIKGFAYCNKAEIYLINGAPVNFFNNTEAKNHIQSFNDRMVEFLEKEAISFFEKVLEPMMKKEEWTFSRSHIGMPILIEKDDEGEWDNIRKNKEAEFDFEYLCSIFIRKFEKVEVSLKGERGAYIGGHVVNKLFSMINEEYFKGRNLYVEM